MNRSWYLPLGDLAFKNSPFECKLPLKWTSNKTFPGTPLCLLLPPQTTRLSVLYPLEGGQRRGFLTFPGLPDPLGWRSCPMDVKRIPASPFFWGSS